ncbi:diguanylate cyclase domain-containing protein [Sulfuricurvum sp.]|uniref:diguanylate cyclase domain-containing protein n=1 Tax=Sulfuricurvum sp. TaxID=2025608 RepID=UPI003566E00B
MLIGVVLFTLFIVGLERYQLSENIVEQFIESEKSKNNLLINTISPIIALNISLGLGDANQDYLGQIAKQNSDLEFIELIDNKGSILYRYFKGNTNDKSKKHPYSKNIIDPVTAEYFGKVTLYFDNHDYQMILQKNKEATIKIFVVTFFLLMIFIYGIKREFKYLKELSRNVLKYDPKQNNFTLTHSHRTDEVGVIHNAIISMVEKIHSYASLLDEVNQSLESKVQERTKELEEVNIKLNELSITDPLTKLSNRRHFDQSFKDIWNLAYRKQLEVVLIMCDIDYFKQVNDTYGHVCGDMILKEVGTILKKSLKRSTDFIARYGGEEFVIVLYDTNRDDAKELCLSIKQNLKSTNDLEFQGTKIKPVTMSFGISSKIPNENYYYEDLIKTADMALYKAKEDGRDCIVIL